MQHIDIDVVGSEAFQRTFDRPENILAPVSSGVGIAGFAVIAEFGGNDDAIASAAFFDKPTQHSLAIPVGIEVGRIDKVTTGFEVSVK